MSDVLTFTITYDDGKYASENNKYAHGLAYGKKSDIYKKVEREVKKAAEREMQRTGWTTATCECLFAVTRIMPRRWIVDSVNLGTPEANALKKAGVWADDRLAQPSLLWVRHDPDGQHRVVIYVQKLHLPANVSAPERRAKIQSAATDSARASLDAMGVRPGGAGKISIAQEIGAWRPGQPVPQGYAVESGRNLVPIDDELLRRIR